MAKGISSIDDLLTKLGEKSAKVKEAALDEDMGSKDTTHPSAKVDNNTESGNLEGARSAENTADNKKEQPVGVEDAGSPEVKPPAGSQGVEDKEPDEGADMDTGDTSGVSEMLESDTEHPSKAAAEILTELDEAIKNAEEEKVEKTEDKEAEEKESKEAAVDEEGKNEKTAEEKIAEHIEQVVESFPEDFEYGVKLGSAAFEQVKAAKALAEVIEKNAQLLKKASADGKINKQAMGEMAPGLMGDQAAGASEEDVIDALAQAMAAEGVTPEDLAAAIEEADVGGGEMPMEGGGADMGEGAPAPMDPMAGTTDEEQIAALEAAMQEANTAPADVAGAMAGGDETVQEEAKVGGVKVVDMTPGSEKVAAIIAKNPDRMSKISALKDAFVKEIRSLTKTK